MYKNVYSHRISVERVHAHSYTWACIRIPIIIHPCIYKCTFTVIPKKITCN